MKYQLEITTLLVPVNVHQLFEKCEWPELNSFDKEMVEDYFSDLVNGIQTDEIGRASCRERVFVHV